MKLGPETHRSQLLVVVVRPQYTYIYINTVYHDIFIFSIISQSGPDQSGSIVIGSYARLPRSHMPPAVVHPSTPSLEPQVGKDWMFFPLKMMKNKHEKTMGK